MKKLFLYRFLEIFMKKGEKTFAPKGIERGGGGQGLWDMSPIKVFFIDALSISNGHTQSCSVKIAIKISSINLKKDRIKVANAPLNTEHNNSTSQIEKDGSPIQVPNPSVSGW